MASYEPSTPNLHTIFDNLPTSVLDMMLIDLSYTELKGLALTSRHYLNYIHNHIFCKKYVLKHMVEMLYKETPLKWPHPDKNLFARQLENTLNSIKGISILGKQFYVNVFQIFMLHYNPNHNEIGLTNTKSYDRFWEILFEIFINIIIPWDNRFDPWINRLHYLVRIPYGFLMLLQFITRHPKLMYRRSMESIRYIDYALYMGLTIDILEQRVQETKMPEYSEQHPGRLPYYHVFCNESNDSEEDI